MTTYTPILRAILITAALSLLSACNSWQRLSHVGGLPDLSEIENPVERKGYRPVSLPQPMPPQVSRAANSLWRAGARGFFKDQRAREVGDILTVSINLSDSASLNNTTSRSRKGNEDAALTNFLGLETNLAGILPDEVNPAKLADLSSAGSHTGVGTITRGENINLKIAAVVTQVLPNGNMVIQGRQEVRVNFETRELLIAGVIRPEDISSTNTIAHDKIAEARISYGGRGQITDVQQPRYGQQVFDIIFPF